MQDFFAMLSNWIMSFRGHFLDGNKLHMSSSMGKLQLDVINDMNSFKIRYDKLEEVTRFIQTRVRFCVWDVKSEMILARLSPSSIQRNSHVLSEAQEIIVFANH